MQIGHNIPIKRYEAQKIYHRRQITSGTLAGMLLYGLGLWPSNQSWGQQAASRNLNQLLDEMEAQRTQPVPSEIIAMERAATEFSNETRRQAGKKSLTLDSALTEVARFHSHDMGVRNYLAHRSPDGISHLHRVALWHRRLIGLVGENLYEARMYSQDHVALARMVVQGWLKSPSHRANLLQTDLTHIGIGVEQQGDVIRFTQILALVSAYLITPVPHSLPRGSSLDLTVETGQPIPSYFALGELGAAEASYGPYPIINARIDAPAGDYILWFYFSDGKGFRIVFGPYLSILG